MGHVPTLALCVASLFAQAALASTSPPVLTISDVLVDEGGPGQVTHATFKVSLNAPAGLTEAVRVHWTTQDVTAHAPGDYQPASGTLEFTTLEPAFVPVDVFGDAGLTEGSEVFFLRLYAPTNATLGKEIGQGVIEDNGDLAMGGAKCDLDGDGRSNLLVFHPPVAGLPQPPLRHRPLHQDWGLNGPLASAGPGSVVYDETEHQEDWNPIAMDDFDGNGTCDLFWKREGQLAVTFTGMDGVLLAPHPEDVLSVPHPDPAWRLVGSGPFDADALSDLVWWDPVERSLQVWLWVPGSEPPSVSIHTISLADGAPAGDPVAVLDQNSGQYTGLLWRDGVTGALAYSQVNGLVLGETRSIRYPTGTRIDLSWRAAATGDFDGDGDEDVVWQQANPAQPASGGRVAVWLMNGTTHVRETSASPELLVLDPTLVLTGIIDGPR